MPETSFVQKFISQAPHSEPNTEWRSAFTVEREGSAQCFCLSVRSQDGRFVDGFAVSLYLRHKWLDRGARLEKLVLLFNGGAVYIEGQHLKRGLDALEEGKLKRIQEQNASEIALIKSRNADTRKPEEKEPIVSRVVIAPSLERALQSDENLAEIAGLIKEDYVHHGGNDKSAA